MEIEDWNAAVAIPACTIAVASARCSFLFLATMRPRLMSHGADGYKPVAHAIMSAFVAVFPCPVANLASSGDTSMIGSGHDASTPRQMPFDIAPRADCVPDGTSAINIAAPRQKLWKATRSS